jgi:hypothetical protein
MLIKMCLNETYSRLRVRKYLSDMFRIKNSLKKCIRFIKIHFQLYFRVRHQEGSGKPGWFKIKWYTST